MGAVHRLAATALVQPPAEPGQHHQQWQETHPLGHRADASGEAGQPQCRQVAALAEVAQQAPQGQRGHAHQHHVDLRALGHQAELQGAEQCAKCVQRMAWRPQPARQVRNQPQAEQRGQQRRQQERPLPAADHLVGSGLQPHEHRRLFGVQLTAPVRQQPLAALHHGPRGQYEPWLVRWLRLAHAKTGSQRHHDQQPQQGKVPAAGQGNGHGGLRQQNGHSDEGHVGKPSEPPPRRPHSDIRGATMVALPVDVSHAPVGDRGQPPAGGQPVRLFRVARACARRCPGRHHRPAPGGQPPV
ncbi:hypothetical protein D3C73_871120 [compost metagenome]